MRDLEKIKAKRIISMDKGKISLILATGIAMGVTVFLVGLLLGLKKPNEAEASSLDPLDELLSQPAVEKGEQGEVEQGADETGPLEYATRLAEDREDDTMAPPLIPAGGEGEGDDPLPVDPAWQKFDESPKLSKLSPGAFKIPDNPAEVVFTEPELSSMSTAGEKGIFTLHVNSFSNKVEASGYVSQLRKMGYKAFLVATYSKERGALYRVRLGPFLSKNEAEKYRKKFEEQEGVPTYVVKRVLEEG
jgi:cell division septation protein DedD